MCTKIGTGMPRVASTVRDCRPLHHRFAMVPLPRASRRGGAEDGAGGEFGPPPEKSLRDLSTSPRRGGDWALVAGRGAGASRSPHPKNRYAILSTSPVNGRGYSCFGAQSSILVPSGSVIQAKLPCGSLSSRLRMATPFSFSRARKASMSSTAKLIM